MSVISYGNVTVTNINDGVDGTDGQMLYATCSTAANVATKVATLASGTLTLTAGTTVAITFTYTNTAENPTLNVSSTGDIAIYAGNVNLPDIYNWQAGDTIVFVYNGTNWQITNTNNNDRTVYKAEVTAEEPIPAATIGVFDSTGKIKKLTASSAFDLSMPILYIGTAYEVDKLTQTNNYTFWGTPFDLTATHSINLAAGGKPVYIEGTISGNMFTPTSTVLTCDNPQITNGYYYLRLGLMSTSTTAVLQSEHPLYSYTDGSFQRIDKGAMAIATATKQYFWHDTQGAHVGTIANNNNTGYNSLWNTNGMLFRENTTNLAAFTTSSIKFYDGEGNNQSNVIASFGTNGFQIGTDNNTKITIDSSNGLKLGQKIQITNETAILNSVTVNSGTIAGLNIQKVTQIEDYYPSFSENEIYATDSQGTIDNTKISITNNIVELQDNANIVYTFPATIDNQLASIIYYSPILTIAENENVNNSETESDDVIAPEDENDENSGQSGEGSNESEGGSGQSGEGSNESIIQNENNIVVKIEYLDNTNTVISNGIENYTSSYLNSGTWTYKLNQTLLGSANKVRITFSLLKDATISLYVSYGVNSGIMYNTTKLLGNSSSIYMGTDGISVGDKVALLPTGTIQTNYIEVRGKGMEFIDTNDERAITIKNTAYDEGKTYATDSLYPHNCALYGGNSTSRMAFGLFDHRQSNAVWRYDDHNNVLRIEKKSVFYASLVPDTTNTRYLGVDDARFYAAYIGAIQIGLAQYNARTAAISTKWADNNSHNLITRSTDGLTAIFGWSGSMTGVSTVRQTKTKITGYEVSLNSNGGGIKLNGGVTASGAIVPKTNNSIYLGSYNQRWGYGYIRWIQLGTTSMSDGAGLSCYWKDGEPHNLLWRDDDGLTTYLGLSGTSSYKTKVQINGYDGVTIAHDLTVNDTLTVKKVTSITPTFTSNQTPNRYQCVVSGGICHFWYMGAAATQSSGTSLGTLPSGARPTSQVVIPFIKMSGGTVGVISITTAGAISVSQITSATDNTRIYFNCSFPVV